MITEKVLGAYSSVASLPVSEQVGWYQKCAREWKITTFELPLLAGVPLSSELVDALAGIPASLVVTLVAQWATAGQKNPQYGLAALDDSARETAVMDACSIVQQCLALSQKGIRIRNVVVQTGQRTGETIPHAIAFYRSLVDLRRMIGLVLPESSLAVEPCDCLPASHAIPFPAAKKSALDLPSIIHTLTSVNEESSLGHPVHIVVNWGRLLINGNDPLASIRQILESDVPLAGVIMSGAGASPDGFRDSHNSHLDPQSGFTADHGRACAQLLRDNPHPIFIGMKCSRAKGSGQVPVQDVLSAQATLLNQVA